MAAYRMGWVVGYVLPDVVGDNVFLFERNVSRYTQVRGRKIWRNEKETRVFHTAAEAESHARFGQTESIEFAKGTPLKTTRWFWRAYKYSTDNPAHAKGMPRWTAEDDMIHWMSDEEGRPYVEVLPDPAKLVEALSRIRPAQPEG